MTTPHRTLQMALASPEPVAYLVEGWHDGKLIARIPRLTLEDAKASAAVFSQHYTTTKLVPLYAAPPAAPAPTAPVPDGWVMVPRGLLRRLIAEALTFDPSLQDKEAIEQAKQLAASPAAPAAPVVPLTDTETHAELWKLAVRKGLITVRSELIDPRNHGTRVSWMQGHDKACDISNDAAAHGIAASPAAPAAPVVPLTDERITKALRRAFSLGQTYWQQADSDSYTQNAKSDETRQKFETLIVETLNGITGGSK